MPDDLRSRAFFGVWITMCVCVCVLWGGALYGSAYTSDTDRAKLLLFAFFLSFP